MVSCGNCGKNIVGFQWIVMEVVEFVGENIEQDFGIGGGVDMMVFFFKQFFMQFVCVSQVVIMG